MGNKNVLLIGGTGRSGTTILNRIFSSHPNVTDVPEWRFLIDPDGIIDFYKSAMQWSPYHYDVKLNRLEKLLSAVYKRNTLAASLDKLLRILKISQFFPVKISPRYAAINIRKHCPDFDEHAQELLSNLQKFKFAGSWIGAPFGHRGEMRYHYFNGKNELAGILSKFLYSVMESVQRDQGCEYYLEKNTWNILWFDCIRELLPNAKIVHIYRDPRDVVASYVSQKWMPSDPVQGAVIYRDLINRWFEVRQNLPSDSFFEISLEEVVREPQFNLEQICKFWDIPWDNKLLSVQLNRSHTGRWKKDLTKKQKTEVQQILSEQISKLGYPEE